MNITCPECDTLCAIEPVTVVFPDSSEQDALFRGDLNQVQCPECGSSVLYETPILYRDDPRRQLIYLLPASHCPSLPEALTQMEQLTEEILGQVHANDRPDCRLVTSRQHFIEKIALLQAGYNDRLIEYCKHVLFEHNPGLHRDRHEILFDFSAEDEDAIVFQVFDNSIHEHVYTLEFRLDDYFDLEDYYLNHLEARDQLDGLFPTCHVQVSELASHSA